MEVAVCRAPVSSGGQVWIGSHPEHLVGLLDPPSRLHFHPHEAAPRFGRQFERVAPPGRTSREWSSRPCGASSGRWRHGTPVLRRGANGRRRRHRPNGRACSRGRAAWLLVLAAVRRLALGPGSGCAACRRECRHAAHSRRGLQGQLQQLVDPHHEVNGGNVPQSRRRDPHRPACGCAAAGRTRRDLARPAAVRGQHLLGDAADRKHLSGKGDMAVGVSGVALDARSFAESMAVHPVGVAERALECAQRAPVTEVELAPDPRLLRRGGGYSASAPRQLCGRPATGRASSRSGIRLDVSDGGAGIGVARLPESLRWCCRAMRPDRRRMPPLSTPPRRADEQLYGTTWDDRSQQRLLGAAVGASSSPPCEGPNLQATESRRPGLESRPQDTGSDNVNGHETRQGHSAAAVSPEACEGDRDWRQAAQARRAAASAATRPGGRGKDAP